VPVRDRTVPPAWATTTGATGATTTIVVSATAVLPVALTRTVCTPGAVPSGMVTTSRKLPLASATALPSKTGSLNNWAASGLPGGKPLPVKVSGCPAVTCWGLAETAGTAGATVVTVGAVVTVAAMVDVTAVVVVVEVEVEVVVGTVVVVVVVVVDVAAVVEELAPGAVVDDVAAVVVEVEPSVVEVDDGVEVDDEVELDEDELVVPVGTLLDVVEVLDVDVVDDELVDDVLAGTVVDGCTVVEVGAVVLVVDDVDDEEVEEVEEVGAVVVVDEPVPVIVTGFAAPQADVTGLLLASPL
jgi:hypothetical protein